MLTIADKLEVFSHIAKMCLCVCVRVCLQACVLADTHVNVCVRACPLNIPTIFELNHPMVIFIHFVPMTIILAISPIPL